MAKEAEVQDNTKQLEQVQEELDKYFMFNRDQAELIARQREQQRRAVQLLLRYLSIRNIDMSEYSALSIDLLQGMKQRLGVQELSSRELR
jgi:hypothetical protein